MIVVRETEDKEYNDQTGELETVSRKVITSNKCRLVEVEDYSSSLCQSVLRITTLVVAPNKDRFSEEDIAFWKTMGNSGEKYLDRSIESIHSIDGQPAMTERRGNGYENYMYYIHGEQRREKGPIEITVRPDGMTEEVFPRLNGGTITRIRRGVHRPELKPIAVFMTVGAKVELK